MRALRRLDIVVYVCATSATIVFASGCGSQGGQAGPPSSATMSVALSSTTETSSSATTVTSPSSTAAATLTTMESAPSPPGSVGTEPQSEVARLFADLARIMAPLPVYGLDQLPDGASLALTWWPALSLGSPSEYSGSSASNPRVSDSPPGTQEAQVLLQSGDGWLVILENFRGDLGDVSGPAVGVVAGSPAALYEVNGGALVQWSDHGAWYGVFGRDIPADVVVETALSLTIVDPGH